MRTVLLASLLGATALAAAPTDTKEDRLIRAAFTPSDLLAQGEVRLVQRGEAQVVQTVLFTRFLDRVINKITKGETGNWPEGAAHHQDAMKYLEALGKEKARTLQRFAKRSDTKDPRYKMLLEFIYLPGDSAVVFYEPVIKRGARTVTSRTPVTTVRLSEEYIRRNMKNIIMDTFAIDETEAARLLPFPGVAP